MCTILLAYEMHAELPLILLANRDEFYDRPTLAVDFWEDAPEIYAGRDLTGGGTWLGATRYGRFAAVTNYREPKAPKGELSRGLLVSDFLRSEISPNDYLEMVARKGGDYSGFNLLVGEVSGRSNEISYYSNRGDRIRRLGPGIYGLSNHLLDTPWPKVRLGKKLLREAVEQKKISTENLFRILEHEELADDAELPDTGIGYEREKKLSAIFIKTPDYGTRSSSLLKVMRDGKVDLIEKRFV